MWYTKEEASEKYPGVTFYGDVVGGSGGESGMGGGVGGGSGPQR